MTDSESNIAAKLLYRFLVGKEYKQGDKVDAANSGYILHLLECICDQLDIKPDQAEKVTRYK